MESFTYEVSDPKLKSGKSKHKDKINSNISFVPINKIIPPEIHEPQNKGPTKDGSPAPEEQPSFFKKYVYKFF